MGLSLVTPQQEPEFDDFWLLYPKRAAKKDARKMWDRMTREQKVAALTACVAWRPIWAQKEWEYLPHPATWLNGERWEDELPSSISSAAHVAANVETRERGEMPAHVRELLARLRK